MAVIPNQLPSSVAEVSTVDHLMRSMRPEMRLLLACAAKGNYQAASAVIAELLRSGIDWSLLIYTAAKNGMLPLLYWNLRSHSLPQNVEQSLKKAFLENAKHNLFRTRELLQILERFEAAGIDAVCFKGPVLAQSAYGNIALRQFGDLDILIEKRHLRKAIDILLVQGYKVASQLNWWELRFQPRLGRKDIVLKKEEGILVELHWQLSGNHFKFPLDLKSLAPRLQTSWVGQKPVRCLATEDLLLFLCLHGSRHGWERLLWVCDVAELIRNPQINWNRVTADAELLGCARMLKLGLLLAKNWLAATLPERVEQSLQDDCELPVLEAVLRKSLFESGECSDISYWYDIHMRMRERPWDRFRLGLYYYARFLRVAVLPNELDHAILKLPEKLSFLYFVMRPFRLIKSFGVPRLRKLRPTRTLNL